MTAAYDSQGRPVMANRPGKWVLRKAGAEAGTPQVFGHDLVVDLAPPDSVTPPLVVPASLPKQVFDHIGDADVVSFTNDGAEGVSVFARYTSEINQSRRDTGQPTGLVRLGGGYAFSAAEIDQDRMQIDPAPGSGGEAEAVSYEAKMTVLIGEADNLLRGILPPGQCT